MVAMATGMVQRGQCHLQIAVSTSLSRSNIAHCGNKSGNFTFLLGIAGTCSLGSASFCRTSVPGLNRMHLLQFKDTWLTGSKKWVTQRLLNHNVNTLFFPPAQVQLIKQEIISRTVMVNLVCRGHRKWMMDNSVALKAAKGNIRLAVSIFV